MKYVTILLISIFLTNCSLNKDSHYWTEDVIKKEKNKKKLSKILNENNYSNEDCILILRTIMSKSKRLLSILESSKYNKNIDNVIALYKPPIFWKEKETVKKQVNKWVLEDLKNKIYKINDIELLIKKNASTSLNLLSNFIVND